MAGMRFKLIRAPFRVFGSPALDDAEIGEMAAGMKSAWLGADVMATRFRKDFTSYRRHR